MPASVVRMLLEDDPTVAVAVLMITGTGVAVLVDVAAAANDEVADEPPQPAAAPASSAAASIPMIRTRVDILVSFMAAATPEGAVGQHTVRLKATHHYARRYGGKQQMPPLLPCLSTQ